MAVDMTESAPIEIVSLYHYPVKGLSPQRLEQVALEAGQTMPWDRAYAIENGPGRFDPDNPKYLPKVNFLMLMRNERLAGLKTHFDAESRMLVISRDGKQVTQGALDTRLGRQIIEQFMASYMQGDLKGRPRIVSAPGHSFSDVAAKCLHLVNLASVRDLEKAAGQRLDPLRFRANLYFDGAGPWEEKEWVGRVIKAGGVRLKIIGETVRCEATNVDPETARRDAAIPPTLLRVFGDACLGIYAQVMEAGEIRPGDRLELDA
jgi:uncharacterized protein YcbX